MTFIRTRRNYSGDLLAREAVIQGVNIAVLIVAGALAAFQIHGTGHADWACYAVAGALIVNIFVSVRLSMPSLRESPLWS